LSVFKFLYCRIITMFIGQSAMAFLAALRQLRIFIAIWNMFVIFLMFTMLPFDFSNQLEECRVELGRLKGDAVTLDNEISAILMASSKQAHELAHGQLSRVEAEIAVAESDFRQLANVFSSSWTLANGIGARVRQLDTAKGRVVDCMQLVDDALDLRLCVDGVRSALAVEQFEQAAEHVHRFFGVDAAVRQLSSREGVEDPTALMLDAKARLLEILLDKFEQADRQDDAAVECVEKLKSRLKDDFRNVLLQLNDVDQQKLDSCLAQLDETASKFHSTLSDAIEQLVRTSFKPRLRLAVDCFFNDTHAPSELEFVELESRCLFVENVIGCLQLLLEDLRQSLGERPLAMVHASTATLTADLLEKVTLKGTYNRLGGLLLDKQIRQLANYWTQFAGWSARQRFSRLDQIVSLLNVDSVTDAQNYCQSDSVTWLLNLAEIRQVLALRIDLPGNEIRKIQVVQT
ncbi:Conserved oligomeric Golgi complex subunit 4, partial [Trichinella pseudospiralis]